MSELQKLQVYRYHDGPISPNPWKVVIFLNELSLPWEMKILDRSDPDIRTKEPLVSLTPNGRMPVLFDPNTNVKVWESGAIIEYLLEQYDTKRTLSYTGLQNRLTENSWKHFQMSGQGPYFGQAAWFLILHHEKLPSAIERYKAEIWRVIGVIDAHLKRTGQSYLIGDRISFADLMFVPWNEIATMALLGQDSKKEWQEKYPTSFEWHSRVTSRPSVEAAKAFALKSSQENPGAEKDVELTV